jgi:hypothetical protein
MRMSILQGELAARRAHFLATFPTFKYNVCSLTFCALHALEFHMFSVPFILWSMAVGKGTRGTRKIPGSNGGSCRRGRHRRVTRRRREGRFEFVSPVSSTTSPRISVMRCGILCQLVFIDPRTCRDICGTFFGCH